MTTAAVLVPVHDSRLGFVVRSSDSTTHADDVGFPGGKPEPADDSLRETARRETREETALDDQFRITDRLPVHATRSSGFELHPFLARVADPDAFRSASRETRDAFWVSTADLRAGYAMDGDRIRYRLPPASTGGSTGTDERADGSTDENERVDGPADEDEWADGPAEAREIWGVTARIVTTLLVTERGDGHAE